MQVDTAAGRPTQLLVHATGLGDVRLEALHLDVVVDVAAPARHDGLDSGEVVLVQGLEVGRAVGRIGTADVPVV